ncbi:HAD family hydrolase [Glaciibacter flavus]|uniref:HAD family hydrolase n=1 Tax=Orlajensenia flava TaxID=2565934 RepID=A0A4S4FZQ8_9MICO|nr:HAD family hydrolase [Glaciibacter flavus]
MVRIRGVVLDVGETLVDESRAWTQQAERVGVTPFTLMGMLGALIERGEDHRQVWTILGVDAPPEPMEIVAADLYPDALDCVQMLRGAELLVGIAGNQPLGVEKQLESAGLSADFIASSDAWGVVKPSAEFFSRVVRAAQLEPSAILYVGDRLDNDVLPARRAGMRTALIRRGPWGHIHARRPEAELADLRVDSLTELASVVVGIQP